MKLSSLGELFLKHTCCHRLLASSTDCVCNWRPPARYSVTFTWQYISKNLRYRYAENITLWVGFAPKSSENSPSLLRIPFAFGARWRAAPVSVANLDCSKICTWWPCFRRAIAAVKPPIPAPTIKIFNPVFWSVPFVDAILWSVWAVSRRWDSLRTRLQWL